jgi:DNA-directed RNA polymerase subunit RPC12/RpoP
MRRNLNFENESKAKYGLKCINCVEHFNFEQDENEIKGSCSNCNTSYKRLIFFELKKGDKIKLSPLDIVR